MGNVKGVKVFFFGLDMNIIMLYGLVIIVNGVFYLSIKGNNFVVKFKDKIIIGVKILGSVDLKDI